MVLASGAECRRQIRNSYCLRESSVSFVASSVNVDVPPVTVGKGCMKAA